MVKYIQSIITAVLSHRKQIFRYLLVGGSGFVLDVGILYVLKQIFGAPATLGVICSQVVVIGYNFLLNKYWSFQSTQNGKTQFAKYIVLVAVNYTTGVGAMYLFHDVWGFYYLGVRVVTVVCFVPLNFLAYKYWIYTHKKTENEYYEI